LRPAFFAHCADLGTVGNLRSLGTCCDGSVWLIKPFCISTNAHSTPERMQPDFERAQFPLRVIERKGHGYGHFSRLNSAEPGRYRIELVR
jgi:hypothetical protein